jgi:multidrug resistance efflux pump
MERSSDIEKRIEIRSDSVNEILGRPPKWIIRWGVTVIFSIMVIVLAGSALFSYPDIISAPVVITSGNLPVQMISRSSGRIKLFVKESDSVREKEVLAYIENPVTFDAYLSLKKTLTDSISAIYKIQEERLSLGSIQDYYQSLLTSVKEYNEFRQMDYHNRKIQQLENQLKSQVRNIKFLETQAVLSDEQLKIASKIFERDSLLFTRNAISSLEFEKSKSTYLSVVQQHESALAACNSAQIILSQTKQNINDTRKEKSDLERKYGQSISSALEVLKAKVVEWELQYLLVSPVNGRVSLTQFWQNNQNINTGEMLMTIIPEGNSFVIGKIYLPLAGAGKVKRGQKVNIKLDNYPYMEFGLLQTTVVGISASPITQNNQKQLVVTLDFKDTLITNYHTKIPVNEEMTGTAEIITKDLSAFERIANPIKYLLKKNKN